jgi:hypothetical protein
MAYENPGRTTCPEFEKIKNAAMGQDTGTRTPLLRGLSQNVPEVSRDNVPECPGMSHVPSE